MESVEYSNLVKQLREESNDTLYFMLRNSFRQMHFANPYSEEYQYVVARHNAICDAFRLNNGYGIMEDVDDSNLQ